MVIELTSLYTYPVKSCAALSHQTVTLDRYGPAWDRRWMIVNPEGHFLTQREFPRLALIQPHVETDGLLLRASGSSELCVPLQPEQRQTRQVEVWNDYCFAWDEGDSAAQWVSDHLHTRARLVRMSDAHRRPVDERYAPPDAETTFTDGFPLLIVSEASLADLNRRLIERGSDPVPMSRFRPNLVISGCEAFAEDTWRTIQIGDMTLDIVKPCGRCVTTTVDQATGTVPDTAEPLATLNTFRKQGSKVLFAQNALHRSPGTLTVGSTVAVQLTA